MHDRQHRSPGRFSRATAAALAVALPGALLGLTQAPASAAPLPAAYAARAHGDIVDLTADIAGQGSLADLVVGHGLSTVTSTGTTGSSSADSSNLDAGLVFGGLPINPDRASVTAPPSADPPAQDLADVPVDLVADVGLVTGDVQAAWAGNDACVPASGNDRVLSDARTTLAGLTLVDLPAPIGTLAEVTASQTRTRTALVDDADDSDVVSTVATTVGDIDLLGGAVTVDVTNPVVLQARSDGTTGSAALVNPPTITATVGGTPVDIPLNASPQSIALPAALEPLADLTITAFTPTDQSSGATGQATLDALLRIDLEVVNVPLAPPVADISLAVAPMAVQASAPSGGVECQAGPVSGPIAAPDITSPTTGAVVTDTTPAISGTGQPGATVTVREGGTVLCTAVVRPDGTWSCSPTTPLPAGPHTVTATQSDGSGTTSPADSTTFVVAPDPSDPDGDGLPTTDETPIGTDPNNPDTDGDGLSDGQEVNATKTDPLDADTDDDGLTDGQEVNTYLTDPLDPDTDDDGLTDGREVKGSKIRERLEVCGKKARTSLVVRTDPLRKDTDKDGLGDGREVKGYKLKQRVRTRTGSFTIGMTRSNPRKSDTDRDGLKDKVEVTGKANKRFARATTDPTKCDTDKGGVRDGAEVRARANPADWRSGPRDPGVRNGRVPADWRTTSGIG
jgi:hypothetical protein